MRARNKDENPCKTVCFHGDDLTAGGHCTRAKLLNPMTNKPIFRRFSTSIDYIFFFLGVKYSDDVHTEMVFCDIERPTIYVRLAIYHKQHGL